MRHLKFSFYFLILLALFSTQILAQSTGGTNYNSNYQTMMSGMQTGNGGGATSSGAGTMAGVGSQDPHENLTQFMKMITAFVFFDQSREVCERQDSCDISIPQWQAELTKVDADIANAKQNIVNGESRIANLNSAGGTATIGGATYISYMELSSLIMRWRDYLLRKENRAAELKMNIDMCKQSIKAAKDSFVGLCKPKFVSGCSSGLPAFMNPGPDAIKAQAQSFCEGQLQTTLAWQCPFERAKRANNQRCEETWVAESKACHSGPFPAICLLAAVSRYADCLKDIPGYNDKPLPTPIETDKLDKVTVAGIAACWAIKK